MNKIVDKLYFKYYTLKYKIIDKRTKIKRRRSVIKRIIQSIQYNVSLYDSYCDLDITAWEVSEICNNMNIPIIVEKDGHGYCSIKLDKDKYYGKK
ncbi:MAG: hypothetical protein IKU29_06285 [Parabacteroides sp.]|nr:hypothetical protein [Parabacteroides sp.]